MKANMEVNIGGFDFEASYEDKSNLNLGINESGGVWVQACSPNPASDNEHAISTWFHDFTDDEAVLLGLALIRAAGASKVEIIQPSAPYDSSNEPAF